MAVTDDGFVTSHVVALPASRSAIGLWVAGPRHFVVGPDDSDDLLVVDLAGLVQRVTTPGDDNGPLATGEVVVTGRQPWTWSAVDPVTATAHRLSTPRRTTELVSTPGGQLRAIVSWGRGSGYWVSDDRGATWRGAPLPGLVRGRENPLLLPSAREDVHAVLLGGDGATLLPWGRVLRSIDGRHWTSYAGPSDPTGYVDVGAVLADGRLLLDVIAWSDRDGPVDAPTGLWDGADWSALSPVPLGEPLRSSFDRIGQMLWDFSVSATERGVTVWTTVSGDDADDLVACSDGGRRCRPERAR